MEKFFFEIPLIKSKIFVEISDQEYRKQRNPDLGNYYIHIKNKDINLEVIRNIENILFHIYKKKDTKEYENTENKYKAYYKKYHIYIRQEHKLPLHINNSIVIFEELYKEVVSKYEKINDKKLTTQETDISKQRLITQEVNFPQSQSVEEPEIEEVSLDINTPIFHQEESRQTPDFEEETVEKHKQIEEEHTNYTSSRMNISSTQKEESDENEEDDYDASFLFEKDDSVSINDLKNDVGIKHEDFDSDSEIPDFPMELQEEKKEDNKSRFQSKAVNINEEDESGESLLNDLLNQAGFDKKDKE